MTPHSDPGLAEEFRARPAARTASRSSACWNAFAAWPWRTSMCWSNCRTTAPGESPGSARRDDPVELIAGAVFDRIEDAEWFVFKARWEQHFGQALQD